MQNFYLNWEHLTVHCVSPFFPFSITDAASLRNQIYQHFQISLGGEM